MILFINELIGLFEKLRCAVTEEWPATGSYDEQATLSATPAPTALQTSESASRHSPKFDQKLQSLQQAALHHRDLSSLAVSLECRLLANELPLETDAPIRAKLRGLWGAAKLSLLY